MKPAFEYCKKATDFLIGFYNSATPEQARNAICPSHYMGIIEMYRTTKDPRYLALMKKLIDIRGTVEGTDDNSDREPFREMDKVVGHLRFGPIIYLPELVISMLRQVIKA